MRNVRRLVVLGVMMCVPLLSRADEIYNVSLNTAAISAGTFTLDFQLADGGALGNNTVTITGLDFGTGGSAVGGANLYGGASGSTASGFSLADSSFFNAVEQQFVAGSSLSFAFDLAGGPDGITPDEFAFGIEEISTQDPGGALLIADVGSAPLTFAAAANGNAFDNIGSPSLSVPSAPVPEPSSILLLGSGLLVVELRRRRAGTRPTT